MSMSEPNLHWWQTGVIYQVYPRSFQDLNDDGIGDLPGIIARLDYLNDGTEDSLGIDAIWVSPFYPSPQADFGYDVSDYCGVDPQFGTLEDFDRLVSEAHQRGIRVIIDWVPNHTSTEHPWFIESRSSRDNPRSDWYVWADAKADGSPPNNWASTFGGGAWHWDETRRQYYLHSFLIEQADLNWRNPDVVEAMLDTLRFWLDRGVDGFRMDVLDFIAKHPDMPDEPEDPNVGGHPLNPGGAETVAEQDYYSRLVHLHSKDHDDILPMIARIRATLDEYDDRFAVGEVFQDFPRWIRYFGRNEGEGIHLPFNFRLMNLPWDAALFREAVETLEQIVPAHGWPNYVLGNHDFHRIATRFGEPQARLIVMMLLTLRGTPTLYYGDELGMPDGHIPTDRIQDPVGHTLGALYGRDPARTPMQWDDSPYAGFSSVEPWLPVNADYRARNVAAQQADPASMLTLTRRLLWLRKRTPALHRGTYATIEAGDGVFSYTRTADNETYWIAINFTGETRSPGDPFDAQAVLSSTLRTPPEARGQSWQLGPHEGMILKRS